MCSVNGLWKLSLINSVSYSVAVAVISRNIPCQKKPQGHITLVEFSSRALEIDITSAY